jgi:hypothetical protein
MAQFVKKTVCANGTPIDDASDNNIHVTQGPRPCGIKRARSSPNSIENANQPQLLQDKCGKKQNRDICLRQQWASKANSSLTSCKGRMPSLTQATHTKYRRGHKSAAGARRSCTALVSFKFSEGSAT